MLQHVALCCSLLQCVAVKYSFSRKRCTSCWLDKGLFLGSVLQCVAVCCSALQCVAVRSVPSRKKNPSCRRDERSSCVATCYNVLWCVCSMLQYVAVCCSVLKCFAVRHSVLQCVAVCCSVLQWDAYLPRREVFLVGEVKGFRVLQRVTMCYGVL